MFRSLTIAAVALAACVTGASAADMQLKAPPRLAPAVADSWGGPYIGIHGGYAWTRDDVGGLVDVGDIFGNTKPAGGLFGAQAGLRFQRNVFVFGIEVDYSHLGLKKENSILDDGEPTGETTGVKVHDLASARATLGFEVMPNLLVGASGGLGFGHTSAFIADGKSLSITAEANSWGWVAGAFAELKLPVFENLFLRAEYLHYDLGNVTYTFAGVDGGSLTGHPRADVVRAALSYRFP